MVDGRLISRSTSDPAIDRPPRPDWVGPGPPPKVSITDSINTIGVEISLIGHKLAIEGAFRSLLVVEPHSREIFGY